MDQNSLVKVKHKGNDKDYLLRGVIVSTAGKGFITESPEGVEYTETPSMFNYESMKNEFDAQLEVLSKELNKQVVIANTNVKGVIVAAIDRVGMESQFCVQYADKWNTIRQTWAVSSGLKSAANKIKVAKAKAATKKKR